MCIGLWMASSTWWCVVGLDCQQCLAMMSSILASHVSKNSFLLSSSIREKSWLPWRDHMKSINNVTVAVVDLESAINNLNKSHWRVPLTI